MMLSVHTYVKYLESASEAEISDLFSYIKSCGYESIFAQIMKELSTQIKGESNAYSLVVASNNENIEHILTYEKKHFSDLKKENVSISVDSTLLEGYVLWSKRYIVDNSAKRKLVMLYNSLIK